MSSTRCARFRWQHSQGKIQGLSFSVCEWSGWNCSYQVIASMIKSNRYEKIRCLHSRVIVSRSTLTMLVAVDEQTVGWWHVQQLTLMFEGCKIEAKMRNTMLKEIVQQVESTYSLLGWYWRTRGESIYATRHRIRRQSVCMTGTVAHCYLGQHKEQVGCGRKHVQWCWTGTTVGKRTDQKCWPERTHHDWKITH